MISPSSLSCRHSSGNIQQKLKPPVARDAKASRIDHILGNREADIVRAVARFASLVEVTALGHIDPTLGRSFAGRVPGARLVDGFPVDAQPLAHRLEHALRPLRDRAVGARSHVEQKLAVLADPVHQVVDQALR